MRIQCIDKIHNSNYTFMFCNGTLMFLSNDNTLPYVVSTNGALIAGLTDSMT